MNETVSIIIPTYNESENIPELARRIRASLDSNVNIVVMDDSPNNETAEAALAAGCQVVQRKTNRGLSRAVIEGIQRVNSDIIIVMDADLQHPPEVLPLMLRALQDGDLAVASRWVPGGGTVNWNWKRVMVSKVANLLAWPLVPRIKDRTSGFFGFRRSAINPKALNPTGWKIGLEIMARGNYTRVSEVPYTFVPRAKGESKMSYKQILEYLKQLFTLYMNKFRILNFMAVGGIGYIINISVLSALTYWPPAPVFRLETSFLGQHFYLLPFVISSLIAIASNYLLNKIWTFKGWTEQRLGGLRYLSMALATLLVDMAFLTLLVDYGKLAVIPAAALAILIVFIVRYIIARRWIWIEGAHK